MKKEDKERRVERREEKEGRNKKGGIRREEGRQASEGEWKEGKTEDRTKDGKKKA